MLSFRARPYQILGFNPLQYLSHTFIMWVTCQYLSETIRYYNLVTLSVAKNIESIWVKISVSESRCRYLNRTIIIWATHATHYTHLASHTFNVWATIIVQSFIFGVGRSGNRKWTLGGGSKSWNVRKRLKIIKRHYALNSWCA